MWPDLYKNKLKIKWHFDKLLQRYRWIVQEIHNKEGVLFIFWLL